MFKILHIILDDKFIDGALSLFKTDNRVESQCAKWGSSSSLKYIKEPNVISLNKNNYQPIFLEYNAIILHSFDCLPLSVISNIPDSVKVVWFAWGFDIYEGLFKLIPLDLYGKLTKKYVRKSFMDKLRTAKYKIERGRYLKQAIHRVDYFSGVFPYEFDLLASKRKEFKAKPLDFYYGKVDFFIPEKPSTEIKQNKKDIIIGNSANESNNHLDVLDMLSSIAIEDNARIIIPLSYGGSAKYKDAVRNKAEAIVPGRVLALTSFLPFDEYISLISNCKVAIFAHERQQASDNVFLQLYYGARVYMSENSLAFHYLKSIGLKVFSLQRELELINSEMPEEDIMHNRQVLSDCYSGVKLIERVHRINNTLLS